MESLSREIPVGSRPPPINAHGKIPLGLELNVTPPRASVLCLSLLASPFLPVDFFFPSILAKSLGGCSPHSQWDSFFTLR